MTVQEPQQTSPAELKQVLAAARAAAGPWSETPAVERARILRVAAAALDASADALVPAAVAETALGETRLRGEVARTTGQLSMFADYIERGDHLDAIISHADPALARPDLRRMAVPVGPVGVFSASNFPFAFSVAGGDTASALAAGCPVVVKAHEGHPMTSLLTAQVLREAFTQAGAPDGLFATVYGLDAARALVADPAIKAVGFTGSLRAARALTEITQSRPDPIPFYGELGSINPVVILPGAAQARPTELAGGYVGSLTLGVGQFCTNPGLLFVPDAPALLEAIATAATGAAGGTMLSERVRQGYLDGISAPAWQRLELLARGSVSGGSLGAAPEIRHARLADLTSDQSDQESLTEERFGPAGLVVSYPTLPELLEVLPTLPGSLTASIHAEPSDYALAAEVGAALRSRVGRLIFNGWPTGVAVCWAMHHGGPWPATTAPWSTSVGATAIRRWLIPLAYQDWPDELLPAALQTENPLGVPRSVQPSN